MDISLPKAKNQNDSIDEGEGNKSAESNAESSKIKEIKSRMKEKRKKARDNMNRSKSKYGNLSNVSLMLKSSLRSNNKALAKALEEAMCETRRDKQTLLELQSERHAILERLTKTRDAEVDYKNRMSQVKKVLNQISSNLVDTVVLLGQAAEICTVPRNSKASSILFARESSCTTDDEPSVRKRNSGPNIYYHRESEANLNTKGIPEAPATDRILNSPTENSSDAIEQIQCTWKLTSELENLDVPFLFEDELLPDTTPNSRKSDRLSQQGSKRNSRDPTAANSGTISPDMNLTQRTVNGTLVQGSQQIQRAGMRVSFAKKLVSMEDNVSIGNFSFTGSKSPIFDKGQKGLLVQKGKGDKSDNNASGGNETICCEVDMELTTAACGTKEEVQIAPQVAAESSSNIHQNTEEITANGELLDGKTNTNKSCIPTKREKTATGRVGKKSTHSKIPKKGSMIKKGSKRLNELHASELSVFDLSLGESFTKPSPQNLKIKEKKYEQNLSTESEKDESKNASSTSNHSVEKDGSESTCVTDKEPSVVDESKPFPADKKHSEASADDCGNFPNTRRRSRQSHSKRTHRAEQKQSDSNSIKKSQNLSRSPVLPAKRSSLKPLSEVLNNTSSLNSSWDVSEMENDLTLLTKPTLHRKIAASKQRKKLYNSKLSLEKELPVVRKKSEESSESLVRQSSERKKSGSTKREQRSERMSKRVARVKENIDESLEHLLEESWVKDFLNDIEDPEECGKNLANRQGSKATHPKRYTTRETVTLVTEDVCTRRGTFVVGQEESCGDKHSDKEEKSQQDGGTDKLERNGTRRGADILGHAQAEGVMDQETNGLDDVRPDSRQTEAVNQIEEIRLAKFISIDNPKKVRKTQKKRDSVKKTLKGVKPENEVTVAKKTLNTCDTNDENASTKNSADKKRKSQEVADDRSDQNNFKKQKVDEIDGQKDQIIVNVCSADKPKIEQNANLEDEDSNWLENENLELVNDEDEDKVSCLPDDAQHLKKDEMKRSYEVMETGGSKEKGKEVDLDECDEAKSSRKSRNSKEGIKKPKQRKNENSKTSPKLEKKSEHFLKKAEIATQEKKEVPTINVCPATEKISRDAKSKGSGGLERMKLKGRKSKAKAAIEIAKSVMLSCDEHDDGKKLKIGNRKSHVRGKVKPKDKENIVPEQSRKIEENFESETKIKPLPKDETVLEGKMDGVKEEVAEENVRQKEDDCNGEEDTGRRACRARSKVVYKEPLLNSKLRRGDPFTCKEFLVSPLVKGGKKTKSRSMGVRAKKSSRPPLETVTNVTESTVKP